MKFAQSNSRLVGARWRTLAVLAVAGVMLAGCTKTESFPTTSRQTR
jgi:hypothetical protein